MITNSPTWSCTAKYSLTKWYGQVALLDDLVLGQWICIQRSNGHILWERGFWRPNAVVGVTDDVIVATETRSDGPWTCDFGCYGISLRTGELIWVSHRNGLWGKIVRLFDYIPAFTNELRDRATSVQDGVVFCESGRVLDVRTGAFLRRVPKAGLPSGVHWGFHKTLDPALRFPKSTEEPPPPAHVNDDCYVTRFPPPNLHRKIVPLDEGQNASLYGTTADGSLKWHFRVSQFGYHNSSSPLTFMPPFLYLVVSDSPVTVPIHPDKPYIVRPNPGNWHALTVDARTGSVVQDLLLGRCKDQARIQDVDDSGILFSLDSATSSIFLVSS